MSNALSLKQLSVAIRGVDLLHDITASVGQGEILAVVGPNGAGKTTLFRAISGDLDVGITRGEIAVGSEQLLRKPLLWRAKNVAVLPQLSLLNFPYLVEEVVALGRTPHSTGIDIDKEIVEQAMAAMDITYLTGRAYTELSGGEKQRTQIARVMAQIWRPEDSDFRVLLLDEPTTALDLGHQQQLMKAISDFAAQGVAVLMIVHDINLATKYADKILALRCGRSLAQGAIADVVDEQLLEQLFHAKVQLIRDPETQKISVIS